jgi:hypothetical protein
MAICEHRDLASIYPVGLGRELPVADLVRTGLSLERDLLEKSDEAKARCGYQNRSEAMRGLIREHLVSKERDHNKVIAVSLTGWKWPRQLTQSPELGAS